MVNASGSDLLTPAVVTCYGSKAGLANQAGLAYGRLTNGTGLSENSETRRIRAQKLTSPPTSARVPRGRAPMFVWLELKPNFEVRLGLRPCFLKTAPPRLKLHEMFGFVRLAPREMVA